LLIATHVIGCDESPTEKKVGGPYYYGGFYDGRYPFIRPRHELSEGEAKQLEGAYYVAYFNERGDPTRISKILRGELDTIYEYEYYEDGNVFRARIMNVQHNSIHVFEWDAEGKLHPVP
jgi:hypothetical protein